MAHSSGNESENVASPNVASPNVASPNVAVQDASKATESSGFPVAVVKDRSQTLLAGSRFWWLALACLVIAIGLVLWAMPSSRTHVQIHFPHGHGLKAEDAVRYRGIDVGVVQSVHLTDNLDAVDVHVELFPSAQQLAVEGTKFWIVRPQLSISGVSGLETAVGHKYIRVQPGATGQTGMRYFEGLANAPADSDDARGIEILLQADARHSVNVGSAIHFRGVDVGRILAVQLSPDMRLVEIRGKVQSNYRALVTTEAKFWATGGVDFDFSLTKGLKLDTESLDTLARGGVSMLVTGDGKQVQPGHVFPLAARADPAWLEAANQYRATSVDLRGAINLTASWTETGLLGLGKRTRTERFSGVGLMQNDGAVVAFPADILKWKTSALDESFAINTADGASLSYEPAAEDALLAFAKIPETKALISESDIAEEFQPTNCIAVRKSLNDDVYHHLPIEAENLKFSQEQPSRISVLEFTGDRAVWHGAPVLRNADGRLVGILLIDESGARICSLRIPQKPAEDP